jgi:uncharacterized protein (TIGR03083 family)
MTTTSLRDQILSAALERRGAGRPVDAVEPAAPAAAFATAVAALEATLLQLGADDWRSPAHPELGTVRELVSHLVAVEQLVVAWLATSPEVPHLPSDHIEATRWAREAFADTPTDELVARWVDGAHEVLAAANDADPSRPVLAHDLPTDVDGLLVLRTFELWAHRLDVARAAGLDLPPTDRAQLALMSSRLMGAVPVALALRGTVVPVRSIRFVLTGDAGGCYDVELGVGPGGGSLSIVTDTDAICRVAARRLAPAALELVVVEGSEVAAADVVAALDAFARD